MSELGKFRSTVPVRPCPVSLGFDKPAVFIGSCFAQAIGQRMLEHEFPGVSVNPNGIIYNPLSVSKTISQLIEQTEMSESDLVYHDDLWHSWHHHGSLSHPDKGQLLNQIAINRAQAWTTLKHASHLFITFGSNYHYVLKETGESVANCHKVPQSAFKKEFLSLSESISIWENTLRQIKEFNAHIHIVFTVSPVRHLRDGLVNNQRSKAALHLLVKHLTDSFGSSSYFPAYEIMMDELRDYRYYADDMLHPSSLAEDIIWSKFTSSHCADLSRQFLKDMKAWNQMKEHILLHPETEPARKFVQSRENKRVELEGRYPFLSGNSNSSL